MREGVISFLEASWTVLNQRGAPIRNMDNFFSGRRADSLHKKAHSFIKIVSGNDIKVELHHIEMYAAFQCDRSMTTETNWHFFKTEHHIEEVIFTPDLKHAVDYNEPAIYEDNRSLWQKTTKELGFIECRGSRAQETDGVWSASARTEEAKFGAKSNSNMAYAGTEFSAARAGAGIEGTPLYAQAQGPAYSARVLAGDGANASIAAGVHAGEV